MELTNDELMIIHYHMSIDNDIVEDFWKHELPFEYPEAYNMWKRVITEVRNRGLCKPDGYPEDE